MAKVGNQVFGPKSGCGKSALVRVCPFIQFKPSGTCADPIFLGLSLNNFGDFLGGISGIAAGAKPAPPISDALAMEFALGTPNSLGGVNFLGKKLITFQSVLVVECKFCSQGSTYGTPRLQKEPKGASDCGSVK